MKLVIATPLYPPESGGPATYARTLETELPKRGWSVEVVKFADVRALPKLRRHLAYAKLAYRAAKRADAVLALDPVSVGVPTMLACFFARRPYFLKVGGDYAWEQGTQRFGVTENLDDFVRTPQPVPVRFLQWVQGVVARHARRVIAPSGYLKGIVATWGVPERRIDVVYNAAPTTEAASDSTPADDALAHGASATMLRPYIMTIARLVPWKGVGDAIRALGALRARPKTAALRYVVAGDGPERERLESLARDLGLADAVVFLGAVPRAEAHAYLAHAAAFVLPTRYEGLSHTILEAFDAGVPVVTTPVGGNPELVEDAQTGLMVMPGNVEAIADAVERVMGDDVLAGYVSRNAREKARGMSRARMVEGTIATLSHER